MGFSKIYQGLVDRKERAEKGLYNCIPFPFPRFQKIFPGTEKGKYILITSNQKIGKSKFADYLFVYEPLFFAMENPNFRFKVIYFTLEMSVESKYHEFLCHLLFRLDNLIVSPTQLKSVDNQHPIDQSILDLLNTERYQKYIKMYEEKVQYEFEDSNPTGINKICRDYAKSHGKFNLTVPYETVNPMTGEKEIKYKLDPDNPYTQDDEEEYRIVIIDNAANLTQEKGMSKKETIDKMSKYCISLRDQLKYIIVLIQHQAQSQEGVENLKLDMIKPSTNGLAECKTTGNDISIMMGLYSPFKYGKKTYEGYDITRLRNYCRFMEIIEDREYGANGNICPLFFNGAVSTWNELPQPDDTAGMNAVYNYIDLLERKKREKTFFLWVKKLFNFKTTKNG